MVDIPASLPDDEAVIDRLGLLGRDAGIYWRQILEQSYANGEAMTLVVHNERVPIVANSLRSLLRAARTLSPAVWIAPLSEIAGWWRRRVCARLRVERAGAGAWRVIPPDDHELTVLVRNAETEPLSRPWFGEWELMPPWPFTLHSELSPTVAVDHPAAQAFLAQEGYVLAADGEESALRLRVPPDFEEAHKRTLIEQVETSGRPLVRIWRWPNDARSALAITSDVDAMTLLDFLRRPLEV
jgi:hypothetical protein